MTARLVALMAFVLFLCLGAFTLLLRTSRETVIEEAEESLRATSLKTLDAFRTANLGMLVQGSESDVLSSVPVLAGSGTQVVLGEKRVRIETERDARGTQVSAVERDVTMPACIDGAQIRVVALAQKSGAWEKAGPAEFGLALPSGESKRPFEGGVPGEAMTLEHVWVTNDEAGGKPDGMYSLTLAFSGDVVARGPAGLPVDGVFDVLVDGAGPTRGSDEQLVTFHVPNRVDHVFETAHQKSLWWFIGVLALGTVLSAGLARRFTRPIRDLDGALRRLSNGELDVTVDVTSKHEVGRLQSAFNAMATRLKKSRELEKELHRREKLTALGRLAAGVAHDVRNPLHSIQLTLDHLTETARPAAEVPSREFERGVRLIRSEIDRLDRLVEDFLCFARNDVRRTERVDIAQVLTEVAQFVAKEADRRKLALVIDAAPDLAMQNANQESLRSALLNLVLNGFEAMDSGGTLTLRASAGKDGVVIEVEDTGRGIASEDQERVFEFGFTTRTDGHGLGLAMVHQIVVEEHGGRVHLESTRGVGTRVRIELPARAADHEAAIAQGVA